MIPRPLAAMLTALSIAVAPAHLAAGDLQSEVNTMFSDLGAIGNYTAPGAFRGQTYHTFTGGNLMLRSPNKTYQLVTVQYPYLKAGCGGIDAFGGSFSHISSAEFRNILKGLTSALPGLAFQLAISSVSPLLGQKAEWFKTVETWVNLARINSCEAAKSLVDGAAARTGLTVNANCRRLAVAMGKAADEEEARELCRKTEGTVLAQGRASGDPSVRALVPFEGNVMWAALKKVPAIDDQYRQLVMSLTGTIVYDKADSDTARKPQWVAPTITSIVDLLYGHADAGSGKIAVKLLTCDTFADCTNVGINANVIIEPFTVKIENLMRSLSDKIRTRSGPPSPQEIGFVNSVHEPVYRMLSVGNANPASGIADSLILQYRDVIAVDYAYTFLENAIRLGLDALTNHFDLDAQQESDVAEFKARIRDQQKMLAQERLKASTKVQSFTAVAAHLEQLERQMRSTLPQHVQDMLSYASTAH